MLANIGFSAAGDGWPTVAGTVQLSGGASNSLSAPLNSGAQSAPLTYSLPNYYNLYGCLIQAACTAQLKVNTSGAPQATINLQSGLPVLWNNQYSGLYQSPFGSGVVTGLFATTSGPGGQLDIRAIFNSVSN